MKNIVSKKYLYMLFLFVIMLGYWVVTPTFAKFSNDYVTERDIVGLNLNFDLKMSNLEEYEEIKIESNSYEIFNINISNSTDDKLFYGVWYKMVTPKEITNEMLIARLEDNLTSMNGELDSLEDKTVSVLIKNNSANDMIVNIGVASSETSVQDIEYLSGKYLITGSSKEVDYYYDDTSKKYISSIDSNTFFMMNSVSFNQTKEINTFSPNHLGIYKIEAWGAGSKDTKGAYASGILKIDANEKLYFYVGEKSSDQDTIGDGSTDVRLVSGSWNDQLSMDSRIMIVGSDNSTSYISGHLGSIASIPLEDDKNEKKCNQDTKDITCSYHFSGKIFKHSMIIDSQNEMPTFDGKGTMIGNDANGYIKLTPIVPTVEVPELKIKIGELLDTSNVKCIDNGNGCHLVRVIPEDTSELTIGTYQASFMVSDDDGIVYRYIKNLEVIE